MNNRVVVTGLGVVSAIGIGRKAFWKALLEGKSGISEVTMFDTSKFKRHYAGEINNFNFLDFCPPDKNKFLGRASQFAVAAAKLSLADAGAKVRDVSEGVNAAVIIGTTLPEGVAIDISSKKIVDEEYQDISERLLLGTFPPSLSYNVARYFGIKKTSMLLPNACAAGNYCLAYGFDLIKKGEIDMAIVGGAEALSRITFQGFHRLYAMSEGSCSPFDKNRKGMLAGEGAGIIILESLERALKRKTNIYAEVSGYGLSCDASHITIPKKEGVQKAMIKALLNSGVSPSEVDYINAHGTGTLANDKAESEAINAVFNRKVPTSSIKSMLGHAMGAASALEAAACCLAIKNNVVPPTINFTTPDPECDIDCVPNKARSMRVDCALNNSFAFGGNNCCVVFKKYS